MLCDINQGAVKRRSQLNISLHGPDVSIRMEDLQAGRSVARRYRNRRSGEFLKELELSEGRSTGIPSILRALRNHIPRLRPRLARSDECDVKSAISHWTLLNHFNSIKINLKTP